MNISPPAKGWTWQTRGCVLLFGAALVVHTCLACIGWTNTLLGPYSFRQAQTAIATAHFVEDGVKLAYETPLLGPPWECPLEFPLFQACVAWTVKATGLDLDVAGRLISWLFFLTALPAAYLLLGRFRVPPAQRLLFLALLLLSPLYIFFSRSFIMESTALSFAAWFLVCFDRFLTRPRAPSWLGALVFGALAGSVKVTTFAIFLIAALLLMFAAIRSSAAAGARLRLWVRAALGVAGPIAVTLLWLGYSLIIRHRNPEAVFLDRHLGFWSFGNLAQRLSPGFWVRTFNVWAGSIVSETGIALIVLYYCWLRGRYRHAVTGCLVVFLSGQLIFSNLYWVHSHYFFANGLFLVAALGFFLAELLENQTLSLRARWIFVTLVIALQLSAYPRTFLPFQRDDLPLPESVGLVQAISSPDDIIVILGQDWDGSLPYYAHRRAFMLMLGRELDPAGIRRSIERLPAGKVAAVVVEGAFWRDGDFVNRAFGPLDLGPRPFLFMQDFGIWVPKNRQPVLRDSLVASQMGHFEMVAEQIQSGQPKTILAREILRRTAFDNFKPRPVRATSLNAFTSTVVDFQKALNAHATTELVFRPAAPVRHISAIYGISDGAYGGKEYTDGVEFLITGRPSGGTEKVLFRRFLNPEFVVGDRGPQKLDLMLEGPLAGEVFLRTLPGPKNNNSFDWSYWGSVRLQ